MQRMVNGILRQYGSPMKLTHGGVVQDIRGFFQPVRSKSWQSMVDLSTPLGEVFRGQYIYIGPADAAAAEGDLLTVGEKVYFLWRVEMYRYGDEAVYTWALCVEKGANDTWGCQS